MRIQPKIVLLFMILTAACSAIKPAIPTITSTPAPYPDYSLGAAEIPTGEFLFLEFTPYYSCSTECNCPVVEAPRWLYEFNADGTLWVDPDAFGGEQALTEMMDAGFPGFYGYGQWQEGVVMITSLPYQAPDYDQLQIYSIRSDGSVVINLENQVFLLQKSDSWTTSSVYPQDTPPGCIKYYDARLTNHGFLTREQIQYCPDQWECN